jgi:hypothetical protein
MFQRVAVSLVLVSLASVAHAQTPAFDTVPIEKATGMKGTYYATENVYKVSKPRANMSSVAGWKIPPFLGTSSYAAFAPVADNQLMVMGDNVLFEDEVGPAMSAALENGLEVTALHNHFFYEEPRIIFFHYWGQGKAQDLAKAVRAAIDLTATKVHS